MSGLTWTKHSYKVAASKRIKEDSGAGMVLRKVVMIENILVMNEAQFRHFYKQFTTHELVGGTIEDINCMKLSVCKELLHDLDSRIDERGVFDGDYEQKEEISVV